MRLTKEQYEAMEAKEIEAIDYMLSEIELVLPQSSKYRSKFERLQNEFSKYGNLGQNSKMMLIRIYEKLTEVSGYGIEN